MSDLVAAAGNPQLSWNLVQDVTQLFDYAFSRNAFAAGTIVAVVAGAVGYFVVLRGLAFAGHALSHIGFAGAAGAVVVGVNAISGLLLFTIASGATMGALGHRIRNRDVVIGIVLAWVLGLGVLFITLYSGYATEAYSILFGEIYGVTGNALLITLLAGVFTLAALALIYRPLLFSSIDEDVAESRGVPVRLLSVGFMVLLALAVSEAVQVVGVLLVFALVVTPAAIAERLTARPAAGIALACVLALVFTWLGLAIAYYSPHPPSFFITTIAFASYLSTRAWMWLRGRQRTGRRILQAA